LIPLVLVVLLQAVSPSPPGLLVERRLAEAVPLEVGESVRVRPLGGGEERTFVVEGVFERAADPARISRNEFEVRFHLPDLAAMLPIRDRVDRFAIILSPGASPDSAARWVESLAYGTVAHAAAELAEGSSSTFLVISRFHHAIGIVTILASSIFLLCVMVIRVDERVPDIRMLRLIGVSRRSVFRTVVGEAIAIAVIGSVVGALLGVVITWLVNAYYMRYYDTVLHFAFVTPRLVLLAAALGVALGAIAGALAAIRVLRLPPGRLGER
jgi:putative ABC transport system permease protein